MTTVATGTSAGDVAEAEAAADRYVEALSARVGALPGPVDLSDEHAALRAAFDRIRPGLADPAIAAADRAFTAKALPGAHDSATQALVRGRLGAVVDALDVALAGHDDRDALDAATVRLEALQRQYDDTLAELEQAVAGADVDRVLELRPAVELTLPVAIGKAKLALLDLQLARDAALQRRPKRRAALAAEQLATAEKDLAAARQATTDAATAVSDARQRHAQAEQGTQATAARVKELRQERDHLAATIDDEQQRRLRRLAGLPDEQDTATTVDDAPALVDVLAAPMKFSMRSEGSDLPADELARSRAESLEQRAARGRFTFIGKQ